MNWLAPEFQFFEKNSSWRLWSIIISVVAIFLAIWQKNILFAIFVLLAEGLLLFNANQKPRDISYGVTDEGVVINEKETHFYQDLHGFSLFDDPMAPEYHELVLYTREKISPTIKILVPSELVEDLHDLLLDHLDELAYEESFINHMSKRLKL